jgi:hypothetical protein
MLTEGEFQLLQIIVDRVCLPSVPDVAKNREAPGLSHPKAISYHFLSLSLLFITSSLILNFLATDENAC